MHLCELCHQPLPGRVYKVGRLRMDTTRHRVYVLNRRCRSGEKEVHLEPQEYACLEVLMRRPGTTFTREVLAEQLATEADIGLITNRLCTLRRKLDHAAHIENDKGVGYRIVP